MGKADGSNQKPNRESLVGQFREMHEQAKSQRDIQLLELQTEVLNLRRDNQELLERLVDYATIVSNQAGQIRDLRKSFEDHARIIENIVFRNTRADQKEYLKSLDNAKKGLGFTHGSGNVFAPQTGIKRQAAENERKDS